MTDIILSNETVIRLGFFLGILALMAVWELIAPRRALSESKAVRWYANLGIVAVNTIVARVVFPMAPVAVAMVAGERGWGLLPLMGAPAWIAVAAAVVTLDFAIYLQHVVFHAVPALWRLHRMHHADLDFDVTTGARFHPVEIVLSVAIKMAVIVLIGAPAVAVLIFEVVLNATAMFNHSNVNLPLGLDRVLRLFVVTPDMHRVHHSVTPMKPIPTSASTCPGGTGCSAPTGRSRRRATKAWPSASTCSETRASFICTGCWRSPLSAKSANTPSTAGTGGKKQGETGGPDAMTTAATATAARKGKTPFKKKALPANKQRSLAGRYSMPVQVLSLAAFSLAFMGWINETWLFLWTAPSGPLMLRNVAGGMLMGWGGILAMGCTIGQGIAGVSTHSLTSMRALAGFGTGAWATHKVLMRTPLPEPTSDF